MAKNHNKVLRAILKNNILNFRAWGLGLST